MKWNVRDAVIGQQLINKLGQRATVLELTPDDNDYFARMVEETSETFAALADNGGGWKPVISSNTISFTVFDRKENRTVDPSDFVVDSNGVLMITDWIEYQGYDIRPADEIFEDAPRFIFNVKRSIV